VFGPEGILNDPEFLQYKDVRMEEISVRHLLNHTAGWSKASGDPVFNFFFISKKMRLDGPADIDDLIVYTHKQKLGYNPGKHYSYSNFGYTVLGRIIEKVSGMPYEDYIFFNILKPLDIQDMHIGRNLYYEKYPNEVMYFEPSGTPKIPAFNGSGQMVPLPYGGNNIELLGAAGGWIASAPELVKLISAIDGYDDQPDILSRETVRMMTDPQFAGTGLFGWRGTDRHGTWWRTGTFSGSTALIVRQENGINWVALLNSSSNHRKGLHSRLSRTMFEATYGIKNWPDINLFVHKTVAPPDSSFLLTLMESDLQ